MTIFVDASAFIALWKKDDRNHSKALQKSQELSSVQATLLTSNIVVAEVLTVMSMRIGKQVTNRFLEYLEKSNMRIIFVDEELHNVALAIFKQIRSKNVSFFDCTSFALMKTLRIDKAFSFDSDFKKQGYRL